MHVLIIPSWFSTIFNPQAGIFFKQQANALNHTGIRVGLISSVVIWHRLISKNNISNFGYNINEGLYPEFIVAFPSIPVFKGLNSAIQFLFNKWLFIKYSRIYGLPDIIHIHSVSSGKIALWIKENYNIPYIVTEHSSGFKRNIYSKKQLKIFKKVFTHSQGNLAVSRSLADLLIRKFGTEFNVLPNMVDTECFKRQDCAKKYTFVNVGFMMPNKKQDLLLKAFKELITEFPKATLAMVGDGPSKSYLEDLCREYNIEEAVDFLGQVENKELPDIYNSSKILVSASETETFGITIIEALSCGLPVVATRSGGPEDIITESYLGQLSDHSAEDLKDKMLLILKNIEKFDSEKIRRHVLNKYSKNTVVKNLLSIYNSVIA